MSTSSANTIPPLTAVCALTLSVMVVEVLVGLRTGSLALLTDAGHMAADSLGLVAALAAAVVARRPATPRDTFGMRRIEVIVALVNMLVLLGVGAWSGVNAVIRLITGEVEVHGPLLMLAAALGLAANIVAAIILSRMSGQTVNSRAARLEVAGDLFGSVAALAAGIVIATTGFSPADSIAALLVVALIVPRAIKLLREVVNVLMEAVPPQVDLRRMRRHLERVPGVRRVHDLHAWTIVTDEVSVTAHVTVATPFDAGRADALLDQLDYCLAEHFGVQHTTFQLEPEAHREHEAQRDLHD